MIDNLPLEIVNNLIEMIPRNHLINLAKVNKKYRYFCNKKIYKQLLYLDEYQSDSQSVINRGNVNLFISSLNSFNVSLIQKFTIFHDDSDIYTCLLRFNRNYKLQVLSASFYNYYQYLQTILMKQQVIRNHIANLLVLDAQDLLVGYNGHENDEVETGGNLMTPYNNLTLNLRSDILMHFDFSSVTCLNLATTPLTNLFLNSAFTTTLKLELLSLTYHHSFAREKLRNVNVDFGFLKKLELKVSCIASCNCLVEFVQSLPEMHLESFSLINYKFNQDVKNLYQFKSILPLLGKVNADLIYIHINDFGNNSFDARLLATLNCQELVVPDFFVNYNFPWNFNKCQCIKCCSLRVQFNHLALLASTDQIKSDRRSIDHKIVRNEVNMKYFGKIVRQAVKQYALLNQAIFATGSVNDWQKYPVKNDQEVSQWETLMRHNFGVVGKKLVMGGMNM